MELYLAGNYAFRPNSSIDIYDISNYNRLLSHGDYQYRFTSKYICEGRKDMNKKQRGQNLNIFFGGCDKYGKETIKKFMKLYFAGASTTDKPPVNSDALFSFADQGKRTFDNMKDFIKPGKLFIDSGAFSAWTKGVKIDVDEYIEWINERSEDIDLYGQLDVIPGLLSEGLTAKDFEKSALKTWENYLYMYPKMKEPQKMLYTFHAGEPMKYLEQALEWTDDQGRKMDYIALGGVVGNTRETRDKFIENCYIIIRKSSNPNVKVHTFGMTDFSILEKYPITSADSTAWIMVGAMGSIMTDFGNIAVSNNRKLDLKHYSHLPKKAIDNFNKIIEEYGFTLDELAEHRDNRILFNAMYMNKKVEKLNNKSRNFNYRKRLF